ncbi:MAG: P-loop NTPase fold protein [Bacteroidota bacterium]
MEKSVATEALNPVEKLTLLREELSYANFEESLHQIIELIPEGSYALAEILHAVLASFIERGEQWFEPNISTTRSLLQSVTTTPNHYALQFLRDALTEGKDAFVWEHIQALTRESIAHSLIPESIQYDQTRLQDTLSRLRAQIADFSKYEEVDGINYYEEELVNYNTYREGKGKIYFLLHAFLMHIEAAQVRLARGEASSDTKKSKVKKTAPTAYGHKDIKETLGYFHTHVGTYKSLVASIDTLKNSPSYHFHYPHSPHLYRGRTLYVIPCDHYLNIRLPFFREFVRIGSLDLLGTYKEEAYAHAYAYNADLEREILFVSIDDYNDLASFQQAATTILQYCQNPSLPPEGKGGSKNDPIRVIFPLWKSKNGLCTDPIDQFRILRDTLETSKENPGLRVVEFECVVRDRLTAARLETYLEEESTYNPQTRTSFSPDIPGGKDQLDIMHEVEAIANLIASQDLKPPLSVGLFGNWGSGKTFFMETLQRQIDAIKGKTEGISENIVHIRFNAWHFVDANLWASIVSNIFQGLNHFFDSRTEEDKKAQALYTELALLKTQQAAAEQEQEALEKELDNIDREIDRLTSVREEKRAALQGIELNDVWGQVKDDEDIQKFLKEAREKLEYEKIVEIQENAYGAVDNIQGLLDRYQSTRGRAQKVIREIFNIKNPKTLIILGVLIILPILAYYGLDLLPDKEEKDEGKWKIILSLLGKIGVFVVSAGAFIKRIIDIADPVLKKVNEGVRYLNKAKGKIENLRDIASKQDDQKIALLRHDYEQTEIQIHTYQQQKGDLEKKKEALQSEINEIENGKKLDQFILGRLSSNDYQKHLGIISLIRNDFDQLTKLLKEQNHDVQGISDKVEKIGKELQIDRIILYIDDLDRCPPDRVVDVLQAVHLILSFPLFVVVVGVDIRWVSKSLLKRYGTMLTNDAHEAGTDAMIKRELRGNATPFDYLEKIFQIPFRLNPISDKQGKIYLASLLENDVVIEEETPEAEIEGSQIDLSEAYSNDPPPGNAPFPPPARSTTIEFEKPSDIEVLSLEQMGQQYLEGKHMPLPEFRIPDLPFKTGPVKITKEEFEFIRDLKPIAGHSPRALKRFVNIARLIKSNRKWVPVHKGIEYPPYFACLTLLAVVVGSPWMAPLLFALIHKNTEEIQLGDFLKKMERKYGKKIDRHDNINEEWDRFREFVINIESSKTHLGCIPNFKMAHLKKIVPIVSRFSFRASDNITIISTEGGQDANNQQGSSPIIFAH